MLRRPICVICEINSGVIAPAKFVAAQSENCGETVDWVLICADHANGWNEGGDWAAPMYTISDQAETSVPP